MSSFHEFYLVSKDMNWGKVNNFVIHDDFISYIDEQVGESNNKLFKVPSFMPIEEIEKSERPLETGLDFFGTTAFNYYSSDLLVETFEQWKMIAEKLPSEIFSFHDIAEFKRKDILLNLTKAIESSKMIKSKNYRLYHYGI
ncbi:hypothetical protein [Rummeliibacillus suwonensis]|uniref:hypothetical protein n=1 Tax=Rummeliibacillus suwonensis TaxID=1306154 RepID=UPI0028A105F0|nr:hypothetical protein [Rummeliibacillus suwonensis]